MDKKSNISYIAGLILLQLVIAPFVGGQEATAKLRSNSVVYGEITSSGSLEFKGMFRDQAKTYSVKKRKEKFYLLTDGINEGWVYKSSVLDSGEIALQQSANNSATTTPGNTDTIHRKNGTALQGTVVSFENGKFTIRTPKGASRKIPATLISRIEFSSVTLDRLATRPEPKKPVGTGKSPATITQGSIGNDILGQATLNLTWANHDTSGRTISAIRFRIKTYNDFGEQINKGTLSLGPSRLISQEDCSPNSSRSGLWNLVFQGTASRIEVRVDDIVFTDGTKWDSGGNSKTYSVKK